MHKWIKEVLKSAGIFLSGVMIISGCGGVGTTSLLDSGAGGNEETPVIASSSNDGGGDSLNKAVVTLSAKFPEKGEVTKSRIDDTTSIIGIDIYGDCIPGSAEEYDYGHVELSPETPSVTVDLSPGGCYFEATAEDALGRDIDFSTTAGTLTSGANSVVITFLRGTWTFVGDDGTTPTPVVLNGGEGLGGFLITSSEEIMYAKKSSIDPDAPYGENWYYLLNWFYEEGTPFASDTEFGQYSQFTGGTAADSNESVINGGWQFLTPDTDWENMTAGDRFIGIVGDGPEYEDDGSSTDPDISQYATSKVENGTTLTGNIVEATFVSQTSTAMDPPTGYCGGSDASASNARAAALRKALAGPAKASTSIGTLTSTWKDCEWDDTVGDYVEVDVTEEYSDVYIHPFTAKGSQLPSSGSSGQILVQ